MAAEAIGLRMILRFGLVMTLTTAVNCFSLLMKGYHGDIVKPIKPISCRRAIPLSMQLRKPTSPHDEVKIDPLRQRQNLDFQYVSAVPALLLLAPTVASAAGPEWLEPTRITLDISLALFSTLFFVRIPMTWYPQMDLNQFPQNLVAWPTEPFLKIVRGITPPLFGVDISPIVVYAVLSFIREIFLGQQGVFTMLASKVDI